MKTLFYCVRCHNLRDDVKNFNSNQIASIIIARSLNLASFSIEDEVCPTCRKDIGDLVSDEILKRKELRNERRIKTQ